MSSDVFARLASNYPHLSGVLTKLQVVLHRGSAGSLFDPHALSSKYGEHAATVLELLAEEGVLGELDALKCPQCSMLVAASDYEEAMEEDEDYACSDCETDLSLRPPSVIRYELANLPGVFED